MRKIKYLLALAALLLCVPALAAETPRLKIEVPGQNVKPQEEFAVTLSLHDIPSIAALGFHISYDKTRLELTGYEDAGHTHCFYPRADESSRANPIGGTRHRRCSCATALRGIPCRGDGIPCGGEQPPAHCYHSGGNHRSLLRRIPAAQTEPPFTG